MMNASADTPFLMPRLPRFEDAAVPEGGASFEDRVLLLLAAAACSDGMLTYPEYELAGAVLRRIFGESGLNAGLQARFHYALLHPPANGVELAASLAREAAEEKVSAARVEALLSGLSELCRKRDRVDDTARRLHEALELAFAEERLISRRLAFDRESGEGDGDGIIGRGVHYSALAGKAAMGGTLRAARHMAQWTRRLLPGQGQSSVWPAKTPTPPVALFNTRMAAGVDALARVAWALKEEELGEELADFRRTLVEQPFRVVLVGEGKRGKSSLINALLGEELSPVRESAPETAATAEFYFSPQPAYAVRFLDEEHLAHLEDYLAGEADNLFLRRRVESFTDGERSRGIVTLSSRADIPDYLAVNGRYSALVAKVSVGMTADILAGGMVLVDTPGLNATDSFHDYLAYEESLSADCLVFVMDARRPDSASELRLLRKLAAAGRAVSVIGVLTGTDRLNEDASLAAAEERALTVLHEACRGAEGMQVLGMASVNAREAMQLRLAPSPQQGGQGNFPLHHLWDASARRTDREARRGLDRLLALLEEAMAADKNKDAYRTKTAMRAARLAEKARALSRDAFARYHASLPPAQFLELLDRHADQLATAASGYSEQAHSVMLAAARDMDEWRVAQERALDGWEDKLILRVMEAAHIHADELGQNFAKESAWKAFDEDEAPRIARQCLDEFLSDQQHVLHGWQEKLRLFSAELTELSIQCLNAVERSAEELGDICAVAGTVDHLLVKSNAHMRQLAVFLAGAGAGTLLAGSLLNLMAWGSAAFLLLTHPLVLPGAALAGVAAYALERVGNPEKRKAAFLARKKKKTGQWAASIRKQLEEELQRAREEVAARYAAAVARGFVPALEILVGEAAHLKLYLLVMDDIRENAGRFEASVTAAVAELEGSVDHF